jgi:cytochrome c oxidase cbb3-type subunit 3
MNYTNDFVSGFWSLYVIVIVLVGLIGCVVLLWQNESVKYSPGKTTGHVWDETLCEYNNPLPSWWRWMFYLTVIFALGYLVAYPGLGNFNGALKWTMRNQYDAEMKEADAKYGPYFTKYLNQDVMTVANIPEAKEMGHRLFLTYCAQCHASDAKGGRGFPDLTKSSSQGPVYSGWLLGGTPERIEATITNGHDAIMTPKGTKPDMADAQIKDVVAYVRSLSGLANDSNVLAGASVERGKELFAEACVACHGEDAKGNQDAGYPNLTDKSYIYGTDPAEMIKTVTYGRINRMPAWGDFLGKAKVHLLTAYVWGLGAGVKPEVAAPVVEEVAPSPVN